MTNPYQVLGANIPGMFGRKRIFTQLVSQLTKSTPDHVSVVGPSHIGKSVLLNHLAHQFTGTAYIAAAYWDLRHNTPKCDADFMATLCKTLKDLLEGPEKDLAECLGGAGSPYSDQIALVLDELGRGKKRILLVLDGFDYVLGDSHISRNTWDALRSFAQKSSLRLVTGSRRPLREICKTEESATSDFWEVFNPTPLRVGRFEQNDWTEGLLAPFEDRGIRFGDNVLAGLVNWTGGIPVLAISVLHSLYDSLPDQATVTKSDVEQSALRVGEERRDLVVELWDDCTSDLQSIVADLDVHKELQVDQLHSEQVRELTARGFAQVSGQRLVLSSELITSFAKEKAGGIESLRRLFGTADVFAKNSRTILEFRLKQIDIVDQELYRMVANAVREIYNPIDAIGWARRIANQAFKLVWKKELPTGEISLGWVADLKNAAKDRRIPTGGAACRLLQLATGTDDVPRLTKWVSKRTYALLNFVQSVGDHGQHHDGHAGWAYATSFCLAAISLCESLFDDFSQPALESGAVTVTVAK